MTYSVSLSGRIAYAPLGCPQKETYDQKYRYMWGVCNTPLPGRTERSIAKIKLELCETDRSFF